MIPFYSSCVDWPTGRLPALLLLVDDGVQVSRETFRRRVRPAAAAAWDTPGLHPRGAWHVSYWRLPGLPVYWYVHSCIEYVWADPQTIRQVHDLAVERLVALVVR